MNQKAQKNRVVMLILLALIIDILTGCASITEPETGILYETETVTASELLVYDASAEYYDLDHEELRGGLIVAYYTDSCSFLCDSAAAVESITINIVIGMLDGVEVSEEIISGMVDGVPVSQKITNYKN